MFKEAILSSNLSLLNKTCIFLRAKASIYREPFHCKRTVLKKQQKLQQQQQDSEYENRDKLVCTVVINFQISENCFSLSY